MELTIKLNLDKNVHSKDELIEASKYLKLLSQHFEYNIIQKKGTLGKDKTFFSFNTDMPINDKTDNKIGFYRIDKKEKIKDIDMGEWSRKHFGYKKDGYLHFQGKKTKIDDDDFDEWED